jgi:hypothetical protein
VDYTFHNFNKYFVDSWEKACNALAKGERLGGGGGAGKKQLCGHAKISGNEVVTLFDSAKLVYKVKSLSRMNISGEISSGCIYRVEIGDVVSYTCMTHKHCFISLLSCNNRLSYATHVVTPPS